MKKVIILCVFGLFFNLLSFCQSNEYEPYKIEVCTDIMTDKSYAFGNSFLSYIDEEKDAGFGLFILWTIEKGKVKYNGLRIKSVGIGDCGEKDELILLFQDGNKESIKSWNDFNCEGKSLFDLYAKMLNRITKSPLKAIRFTNGRTYESLTYKVDESWQKFFIDARKALESGITENVSCDEF